MPVRVIISTAAAARLDAAAALIASRPATAETMIVSASRGAADDLARDVAQRLGATFGISRFSFTELAARLASASAEAAARPLVTHAGAQAAAARAAFDALGDERLRYFAPVAKLPGFPLALARTLHELRLAQVDRSSLMADSAAAADLARLLDGVDAQTGDSLLDRAALFGLAATAVRADADRGRWAGALIMLDVPLDSRAETEFALAIISRAPSALITIPDGDTRTLEALAGLGVPTEVLADPVPADRDLAHLRRYIFAAGQPPLRSVGGDVRLFSAPGEGREAVEIVRRILDEAEAGTRFDEMAVFLRTPPQYLGLLEYACARGGVPVFFDRGTRRPDPSGRAFLALLACAAEGLSARRFDEYLSLGQVPRLGEQSRHEAYLRQPAIPLDEVYAELRRGAEGEEQQADDDDTSDAELPPLGEPGADNDDAAVVFGTLRAPWRWEELIVESAVIAGRTRADGAARWRRRLRGLKAEFDAQLAEICREDPDSGRARRLRRDLINLDHLTQFALPIVELLAAWPERTSWGEWLDRFNRLAVRGLKSPQRVQQLLAELRPMAAVTDVTLDEATRVLHDRLATLDREPPSRRYGRVFVSTPHQARGRSFRVVFVPGLAERVVPQRPREDPLLLDEHRAAIDGGPGGLVRQDHRAVAERLLLKVAIGAARERLYLSYPRVDSSAEGRARVPSFYALDVMRAMTGRVPDHRALARGAAEEAGASLAWPAPQQPRRAIDDLEHDLAVLRPLLESRDLPAVKGRAHYLLALNPSLQRSITQRWLRDKKAWSRADGLIANTPATAPYLAAQRLGGRAYSLSALQRFANCPYQFLLAAILRLEPWVEPEPLVRLDPLTRGSLFHAAQAAFQRELHEQGALPLAPAAVPAAVARLDAILDGVAASYKEQLAPAIERVWRDEIDDLRRDLAIWVRRMAEEGEWIPELFEWSFGLPRGRDDGRDPRSIAEPVMVGERFRLRGSVDLIERHASFDVLRVTDHKTGRNRSTPDLIVGGGATLQPVLYSMVVEQALARKVMAGRLYFSTTAGGFASKSIELNDYTRGQGLQVLTIVDRAVEQGFLVPAPAQRACTWCDFRAVCGPHQEERAARKSRERLADLEALRSMR